MPLLEEAFAEMICRKIHTDEPTLRSLIEKLFAHSRHGHLCYHDSQGIFNPSCMQELTATTETFAKPIGKFGSHYYLQKNWIYETRTLSGLKRLLSFSAHPEKNYTVDPALNALQEKALHLAMQSPFMILTGGPGRGKTFVAKHIAEALPANAKITLAAPTGKAAQHLAKAINRDVTTSTLHALLQLHKEYPPKIAADLLIVDECSMIDARIFAALFSQIQEGTRVILMGDPDQIPPVDAGTLFSQMCQIPAIPHVHLEECLRSDRQDILNLAENIRLGHAQNVLEILNAGSAHFTYHSLDSLSVKPEKFPLSQSPNVDFSRYRILCGLKRGLQGSDAINSTLYNYFAKQADTFAIPILITRSDPSLNLYNGEMGTLLNGKAHFPGREPLAEAILPAYEYAYALTVHKSQGSEFDEVELILPEGSERFGRELLYTAVTRCRHSLTINSTREILAACLTSHGDRESNLISRFNS
ncbi:MAG: AAA family ATPase [Simkaniaceae bacterium]|nr:AAA family ATPase [Simkaniaceae bacterium]